MYWRWLLRECMFVSVRKDRWLEGDSLPLATVLLFLSSRVKEWTSVWFCIKELGMSRSTVILYNNYIREICTEYLLLHPIQVGGLGKIVEMDETVFLRRTTKEGSYLSSGFSNESIARVDIFYCMWQHAQIVAHWQHAHFTRFFQEP